MSLDAVGLSFSYRDCVVLDSVDVSTGPGRVLSIVGANGAGKTTLLKCLGRLLRPDSGRVYLDGRDLAAYSRMELAKVLAFVPQSEPSRFPMKVFDAVLLGRRAYLGWYPKKHDLDVVAGTLDRLGISGFAMRDVNQLSGGERQKVAIAKAIAQQPQILLLDEPTTYLDLKHQLVVLDVLESLARQGTTVITTIHDLNLALRISDELLVLSGGQIVARAQPSAITSDVIRAVYGIECDIVPVAGRLVVVPHRVATAAASTSGGSSTGSVTFRRVPC